MRRMVIIGAAVALILGAIVFVQTEREKSFDNRFRNAELKVRGLSAEIGNELAGRQVKTTDEGKPR